LTADVGLGLQKLKMEQSEQATNVTNIFKKVENVFVSNSVHAAAAYDQDDSLVKAEKCRIHGNRAALDFVCVVCDEEICQLCKLSEHEGHETKSIPLAADEAQMTLLSALDGRVTEYTLSLLSMRQRVEQQMEVLEDEERATKAKLNGRCAHLLSLIGIDSQEACHLLVSAFQDHATTRLQQKLPRSKTGIRPQIQFSAEEAMSAIGLRQTVLRDMMNSIVHEKLLELDAMKTGAFCEFRSSVQTIECELEAVSLLQERTKDAVSEKNHVAILKLNRQVSAEFSAERTRAKLHKASPAFTYTLQHQANKEIDELEVIWDMFWRARKDEVEKYIQSVLGGPVETKTPTDRPDAVLVDVKLAFRFCEERGAIAKFMCPVGEEKIMVSFATKPHETKWTRKTFFLDGRQVDSVPSELCSLASFPNSRGGSSAVYFLPIEDPSTAGGPFSVFAKFNKPYKLTLSNVESNCHLRFFEVRLDSSGVLFSPVDNINWSVGGRGTTAFDASRTGREFAVVNVTEEITCNVYGMTDGVKYIRQVIVLWRSSTAAGNGFWRHRYEPPTAGSSPTDVCFYDLSGEEVLLVADMGNNSIQVARRSGGDGSFVFDRYLVKDHPLLRCPTALNTDRQGRLWVACLGGSLLTVEPV